jgi:hypothetical protein
MRTRESLAQSLSPLCAKQPFGIEGDGELAGKPVGFAVSRAKSLRTASNNGVDVLSQWADRGPGARSGLVMCLRGSLRLRPKTTAAVPATRMPLGNDFGRRLDIIPRNVRMNVATGIFDARSRFREFSAG